MKKSIIRRYFCDGREFRREHGAIQCGDLLGKEVLMEVRAADGDPVLSGTYRYEFEIGGWEFVSGSAPVRPVAVDPDNSGVPPECCSDCQYRIEFSGFDLQRNALRLEIASMISRYRCGWNIKPGMIGGDPLDYYQCITGE